MRWAIDKRITLLLGLAAIPLFLMTGLGLYNLREVAATYGWATHAQRAIDQIESFDAAFAEAERSQRGFILTHSFSQRDEMERLLSSLPGKFEEVAKFVSDNPRQRDRVEAARPLLARRTALLRHAADLEAGGNHRAAIRLIGSGVGEALSKAIRKATSELEIEEQRVVVERTASARTFATGSQWAVLGLASAAVLITFLSAILLNTQFGRRLLAERELKRTNRELEKQSEVLREGNVKLTEAKAAIEQASRYKSQFLANMSHELRTPLNSILLLAALLEENRQGNLTAEQREYARTIHSSGTDLIDLINDILDLAKVESGRLRVAMEPVSLRVLEAKFEKAFLPLAQQKGLRWAIEAEPGLPEWLMTDPLRLEQILRNLLSNAFKFTAKGEVKLALRREAPSVAPFGEAGIAFSVSDTGIGISEQSQKRIFEAFQQADGSTIRKYGGTGLGLTISRELSEKLGGKISLESTEGKGSVFTLHLPERPLSEPVAPLEPSAERSLAPAAAVEYRGSTDALKGKRLLLVDDDMRNVYALTSTLEDHGLEVVIGKSGKEALEILERRHDIDLVLMDIMLPEMDGYQAMKAIRSDSRFQSLPIIALTAKVMSDDRAQCLIAGANDYILKPIEVPRLFTVLQEWLSPAA